MLKPRPSPSSGEEPSSLGCYQECNSNSSLFTMSSHPGGGSHDGHKSPKGQHRQSPSASPLPGPSRLYSSSGSSRDTRHGSSSRKVSVDGQHIPAATEQPRTAIAEGPVIKDGNNITFNKTGNDKETVKEDSDTDAEPEYTNLTGPDTATNRKRTRMENFATWASKKEVEFSSNKLAAIESVADYKLSTANLIRKQELEAITSPREYQIELFERAKTQNTIAVLDTGSGKTLIAVLLLKHVIEDELCRRGMGRTPRISFFLVDSVTLVFQQAAVLDRHIDQSIGHFCGAMGIDLWSKDTWTMQIRKHMVIVCTAEVLRGCLGHGYIKLDQINLLIFDEAHHTKKDHPYAKIMEDFYHSSNLTEKPRIFGMTASPVDARVDVVKAALELEALLDSKIATTSDLSLLKKAISHPNEIEYHYDPADGFKSDLFYKLDTLFGNMESFKDLFKAAEYAAKHLGPWPADRIWQYGLEDEESEKMQRRAERNLQAESSRPDPQGQLAGDPCNYQKAQSQTAWIDLQLQRIEAAKREVATYPLPDLVATETCLSPKVLLLHGELCRYFERETSTKCIVFVERRQTARLLCDVFQRVGTPFLKPGVLVGVRVAGDMNVSYRSQVITLSDFRKGKINCLFATSVAEEGLDIPDCNLVIRFDLYKTAIQYIQSRGRARHHNSTFIHMIQRGNTEQMYIRESVRDTECVLRSFCQSLPEDRKLDRDRGHLDYQQSYMAAQKSLYNQRVTVGSSGAVLTPSSSLVILSRFAGCLNYDENTNSPLYYSMRIENGMFQAEVFLPESELCSIRSVMGRPAPSKSKAKQSAALQTCGELRRLGLLDENLDPVFKKRVHAMHNAHLAMTSKRTDNYAMLIKPRVWADTWGDIPSELELLVIELKPTNHRLRRPYYPIGFLTRTKSRIPQLPSFTVWLEDDIETEVISTKMQFPLHVTDEMLDKLMKFTFRMFEDCFNKFYERDPLKMSYWLAPLRVGWRSQTSQYPINILDDFVLSELVDDEGCLYPSSDQLPIEVLLSRMLLDPNSGKYRYLPVEVEPNLQPGSPPPKNAPQRRKAMRSILEYSLTLWGGARNKFLSVAEIHQPVLKTELVPIRRNILDKRSQLEKNTVSEVFVCPQPLKVSAIPLAVATTLFAFPAILFRFEAYLIALEACESLGLTIHPALALEAFTKDSDNTEEHRGQQIQYQRGMGKNYERLEFLGDCFLKMGTSVAVFARRPGQNEQWYHDYRMCLICNRNLYNTAIEHRLFESIRSRSFERSVCYPEGLTQVAGRKGSVSASHSLGEKTIADVCEALIGAALLSPPQYTPASYQQNYQRANHDMPQDGHTRLYQASNGQLKSEEEARGNANQRNATNSPGALPPNLGRQSAVLTQKDYDRGGKFDMAVKAVSVLVNNKGTAASGSIDHTFITCWDDYYKFYKLPEYQTAPASYAQLDLANQIKEKMGYEFKYPRLLRSAFIHPSAGFLGERVPHYQRLEFLGDSLLDMACVLFLYHNFPDRDPQWLTEHKMAMVSNKFFGAVAVKLGFHKHLKRGTNALTQQIGEYVEDVQLMQEQANGGMDYWMNAREPPKCLPDIVEAYIGAVFVDSEFNYAEVERFFKEHIQPHFEDIYLYDTYANKHPSIQLEKLMRDHFGCRDWYVPVQQLESMEGTESQNISAVMIHGQVIAEGQGQSGKYAKMRACADAVVKIESMAPFQFREKFGCNCKPEVLPDGHIDGEARTADAVNEARRSSVQSVMTSSTGLN